MFQLISIDWISTIILPNGAYMCHNVFLCSLIGAEWCTYVLLIYAIMGADNIVPR